MKKLFLIPLIAILFLFVSCQPEEIVKVAVEPVQKESITPVVEPPPQPETIKVPEKEPLIILDSEVKVMEQLDKILSE